MMSLRSIALFFVALLITVTAQGQEPSFLPGTRWGLVPPPGFTMIVDPVAAFRHPSGIIMTVIQTSKPLRIEDMGEVGSIEGTGMQTHRLDGAEPLTLTGRPAVIFRGRLINQNADILGLMIEGEESVGGITTTIPDNARHAYDEEAILSALATSVERILEPEDLLADFPLKLGDLAGLRVVQVLMGRIAVLTEGPEDDTYAALDQPFVFVTAIPLGPGDTIDFNRDGPLVTGMIQQQYPDATILSSGRRETARGPVIEVTYSFTHEAGIALDGIAWLKTMDGLGVGVLTQYPQGEGGYPARFARFRDGIEAY